VILLDCDSFIVPAACDLFSIRAFKTLGKSLAAWLGGWRTLTQLAPPSESYMLPGSPHFLGYVPQRFKVYASQPAGDYARYLPRMERQISADIVTVLRRIDPNLASDSMTYNLLGQIKDFSSLATASQLQGLAIKDVRAGTPDQRQQARENFREIAEKIVERVEI
jgi:hypothetical protein